ncbi:MAG: DUF4159 domain-containing protein [Deltaproteobacteria bacterium]|nr:DUF4159 domain-containing protein [Deltaproteobacteria bacterium]
MFRLMDGPHATTDPLRSAAPTSTDRRQLLVGLAALAGGLLLPRLPRAAEPATSSVLRLGALRISDRDHDVRGSLDHLAAEVRMRTSIETAHRSLAVDLGDDTLFRTPVLFWAPAAGGSRPSEAALGRLREHLSSGGLLWIDDTSASGPSTAVDAVVRDVVARLFGRPLEPVPQRDVVFRTFYRLDEAVGRRADIKALEGQRLGRRWSILYGRDDLLGAFRRAGSGGPAVPAVPGGEAQREMAYRLGVNVLMYALCLDYKDDHTHVQTLLRRRRGRSGGGTRRAP